MFLWTTRRTRLVLNKRAASESRNESGEPRKKQFLNLNKYQVSDLVLSRSNLGNAMKKDACEKARKDWSIGSANVPDAFKTHVRKDQNASAEPVKGVGNETVNVRKVKKDRAHKSFPDINVKDPRIDPLFATRLFSHASSIFTACTQAKFSEVDLTNFVAKALSNRCKCEKTRRNVLRFVLSFHDFAMACHPPAPITGNAAIITLTNWLDLVAFRGPTVPPMARYALVVFTEALGDQPSSKPPSGFGKREDSKSKTEACPDCIDRIYNKT